MYGGGTGAGSVSGEHGKAFDPVADAAKRLRYLWGTAKGKIRCGRMDGAGIAAVFAERADRAVAAR